MISLEKRLIKNYVVVTNKPSYCGIRKISFLFWPRYFPSCLGFAVATNAHTHTHISQDGTVGMSRYFQPFHIMTNVSLFSFSTFIFSRVRLDAVFMHSNIEIYFSVFAVFFFIPLSAASTFFYIFYLQA